VGATVDAQGPGELVGRVEGLLEAVEALPDPAARDTALTAIQALLDLYGEGLARIADQVGSLQATVLAGDELVSHLLLVHGLHPVPVEERVREGLDEVRPYLDSHGGDVELVEVRDGVVRLRMQGSCEGCPASAMTLKSAIEDAVLKAAPDVEAVEAEGLSEPAAPAPGGGLLQIELAPGMGSPPTPPETAWTTAGALPQIVGGGTLLKQVGGEAILFLRLDGTAYAYRPDCPGCGGSLEAAPLRGAELMCPACEHHYDARRAGRCLDAPDLHLEPVPLLTDDEGLVRVAVRAGAG
jgi:Fe-S cluster biogenesis protein NfuA/nitrite reductase/ring-hydroxylating ferredoxin subunit